MGQKLNSHSSRVYNTKNRFPLRAAIRLPAESPLKIMNKNKQFKRHDPAKRSKPDQNSTGRIRIFYILTLLLIISSVVLRVTGTSRRIPPATSTVPTAIVHHGRKGTRTLILPDTRRAIRPSENPLVTVARYVVFTAHENNQMKPYPPSESA